MKITDVIPHQLKILKNIKQLTPGLAGHVATKYLLMTAPLLDSKMRPSSYVYHHCRDIHMIASPRVAKFSYTVKLVISYITSVSYLHYFSEVPSNEHVQLHRQQHHAQDLKKRHKFTSLIKIGKNGTLIVFRYPGRRLRFTFRVVWYIFLT